ncbi:MAG: tRNA threonylcarbamoyladenosine dehydratase [Bacteroidales bacterium]|nr:tRNA threonylcarbamoyladenosine dehydratase [Bacteroidales bacterium]
MKHWQERTALLLGEKKLVKLSASHVLVVGLGGVGAYAAEQLVRAGVGELSIVDGDIVQASNLNRQLPATHLTLGMKKAEVLKDRFLSINPQLKLHVYNQYLTTEEMSEFVSSQPYDMVLDAIDTLSPKVQLIKSCVEQSIPIVSSMGAGARIDPTKVTITDVSKSYNDRLAFKVRKALHKYNIYKGFKVVFSSELPDRNAIMLIENEQNKKSTAGTISYMPAIFGIMCAAEVIRQLLAEKKD